MFKLNAIVIVALAICVVADPIRQKPFRRLVSAHQQLLPAPAPTGYPAAGATPDIPFGLPNETEKPVVVLNPQPDEVYGPPELNRQRPVQPTITALQPEEIYGPAQVEPDAIYGPPESFPEINRDTTEYIDEEINDLAEDLDEDNAVISVSSTFEKPARLVYRGFPQSRQAPKALQARLIKAKIVQPTNFFYTARF